MKISKLILLFQAIVTLLIGIVFMFQALSLDDLQSDVEKITNQEQPEK
ncbi:MAG: hypothetical protein ACP5D2_01300 [Candidatus Nanoarchaeia archaeon]